jgi:uncharacterized membrane protein
LIERLVRSSQEVVVAREVLIDWFQNLTTCSLPLLLVNNFDGKDNSERFNTPVDDSFRATAAVVSINLAIEGDSTKFSKIKTRNELRAALSRVASDSKIEDCLLSAEILWTPEDRSETLSNQDLYADYPSLYPLVD